MRRYPICLESFQQAQQASARYPNVAEFGAQGPERSRAKPLLQCSDHAPPCSSAPPASSLSSRAHSPLKKVRLG
ncbi:hypothetical protein NDU88_002342 [Pleurodeles waltl]|uniref:Uncharacterized protein n=1 Tax=Pleurodeles waltl TaxID=8319 RepID=A0AAV7WRD5_PLEWA|nr:hypothetical protein NDU88_002342 [Pleurodeles waltl]